MSFITPDIMLDFSNFQNIGLGKILHFLFNLMKMKQIETWKMKHWVSFPSPQLDILNVV